MSARYSVYRGLSSEIVAGVVVTRFPASDQARCCVAREEKATRFMARMHAGEHAHACGGEAGGALRGSAHGGYGVGAVAAVQRVHVCVDAAPRCAPFSL